MTPHPENRPLPSSMGKDNGSLRDILQVLFRRKLHIILFFVGVSTVVIIATFIAAEIYLSEAKLLIRVGRESVSIDPAVVGPTINLSQNREDEVNSELEILNSRYLIEKMVDKIGPERYLRRPDEEPAKESWREMFRNLRRKIRTSERSGSSLMVDLDLDSALSDREKAVDIVQKALNVVVEKKSQIISLGFESQDPLLAQKTLSGIIDLYLDRHIEVHKSQASPRFFEEQTEKLRTELQKKEDELERLRADFNIASLEGQKTMLLGQINGLQQQIDGMVSAVSASKAKIASLDATLGNRSNTIELSQVSGNQNAAADAFKTRLIDLRLKEANLSFRYPDDYPPLIEVRNEIRIAEAALAEEGSGRTVVTTGLDTNFQGLQMELEKQRAEFDAAKAQQAGLASTLAERKSQLAALAEREKAYTQLVRDVDILEKEYRQYRENMQRANISNALDMDKISNVSVVQPASLPVKPIKPKKELNILLGVLLGLFGSIGYAFFLEFLDDSLKSREEVEKRLGLPVLASVSQEEFEACI